MNVSSSTSAQDSAAASYAPQRFDNDPAGAGSPQERAAAISQVLADAGVAERPEIARDIAADLDDVALNELAGIDEGRAALSALSEEWPTRRAA